MQDNLKSFLEVMAKLPSREEFTKAFRVAMKTIEDGEKRLASRVDNRLDESQREIEQLKEQARAVLEEVTAASETNFTTMRKRAIESIDALFTKMRLTDRFDALMAELTAAHQQKLAQLDEKLSDIPTTAELLSLIPPPPPAPELPDVQALLDEQQSRFDEELGKLREELSQVKASKGGGTSAMGVQYALKRLLKTATPTGAIDGVNTTYTLPDQIFAVFCFMLNGEVIALGNYSIKGRTITFATAIPAAYSGKDFEIKYV